LRNEREISRLKDLFPDQRTALLTAVKRGDEITAGSLVDANIADVNASEEDG
jgi:hypothetical protein